jgi:uncharacterized membrane protein
MKKTKNLLKILGNHKQLLVISTFFTILYSLISLINHYYFRTAALDLGAYTNALFDYIHFQFNDSSVFKAIPENLLADHFDLYLILFAPFILLFKTYTLLILQIGFIIAGGIGVYKYFTLTSKHKRTRLLAALFFYMFFGIYSALSFDYHSNVVAACMVPWFFYFFKRRRYLGAILVFIFMLISKENISLWLGFICLGLLFEYRKDSKSLRYLSIFAMVSFLSFYLISVVAMPAISNAGVYPHFHYTVLGDSYSQSIGYLLSHPFTAIKLLFINHTSNLAADYVKLELHLFLLASGLYMLFWKPQYLLMLIPIFFQKLFHDQYIMWGIDAQYSIEFAPIMAIGIFSVIDSFRNYKTRNILFAIVIIGAISSTARLMDNTVAYTNKSKIRFYNPDHYQRDYPVGEVHSQISKIPNNATVSAQSPFLPHLALRDNIYCFPIINDAEYIIYSDMELTSPLTKQGFKLKVEEIRNSAEWEIFFKADFLVILKRRANGGIQE